MKYLLTLLIGCSIGFFVHAFFFPDTFVDFFTQTPDVPNQMQQTKNTSANPVENITQITFDGTTFSKHLATIEVSRYVTVLNTSRDKLMWLSSTNADLSTTRGYGYLEQVKTRIDEKGQVIVADTNNPKERVIITVK